MSLPTPFQAHLGTNYTPSDLDVPTLRQIVRSRQTEASELSHRIEEMEQALVVTKERRAACIRDMEAHIALIAPIRRVPFEVLAAIFHACIPDIASLSAVCSGIASQRHPSVVLSRVCPTWRATALESPMLWSELLVAVPTYAGPSRESGAEWLRKKERLRKAVDVWKQRSGETLLKIRLICSAAFFWEGQSGDAEREVTGKLVEAIKRTSSRWREAAFSLVVGSHWESAMLELLQISPMSLPQLKTLDLYILSESPGMDSQLYHTLQHMLTSPGLLSTPSIRSLKLHGMWGDTSSSAITQHWPPVTSLDIDCFQPTEIPPTQSASQLIRHLNSLPTLVSASFFIQGRSSASDRLPPWTMAANPLEAPVLNSLTLKGAQVPKGFARAIRLPVLRDLHLQFTSLIPEGVESGIVECLLHLGARLKSLTFSPDAVNRHALVKIYESLLVLETLSLCPQGSESHFRYSSDRPGVDCYAITELNEAVDHHLNLDSPNTCSDPSTDTLRCPRLRQLRLQTTRDRYADDAVEQALVELIARRRARAWVGGVFQLQGVSVAFQRQCGEEVPDLKQELKDWDVELRGFDLRLAYL